MTPSFAPLRGRSEEEEKLKKKKRKNQTERKGEMADAVRTGTVMKVERAEKGPARIEIKTDDDRTLKVAAWKTIGRDDPKDNSAYNVEVGDYGTFTGYTQDEEWEDKKFTRFYANSFKSQEPPVPSSAPSANTGKGLLSPRERAVECAKDNINNLISIGALKDVADIPAYIHELTDHYAGAIQGKEAVEGE